MSERVSSGGRSGERLAARRRQSRRRAFIISGILLCILLGVLVYGLWQKPFRISHVVIYGADQSLANIATEAMRGSYLGIIPRDSIFFFPEDVIRANIVSAYPNIAAISIFRNGLTGLSIKISERVPIAQWCGSSPARFDLATSSARSNLAECYFFDSSGFVYATSSDTVQALNSFLVYEPLREGSQISLNTTLPQAERFPAAFDFARQLASFGSSVVVLAFRDDEVDEYLASGTRITYVSGDEENAFTALASARANLNLADGSLDYVDLRFPGKVYLKKKEALK